MQKWKDTSINNCYKAVDVTCPSEHPLTQAERDAGTSQNGIEWDCTDENNAGSECTKKCINGHLDLAGNFQRVCVCKENCVWEDSESSTGR